MLYAYVYIGLAKQGIDVIGESQLVGYPSQFPSVSMMDWKDAKPNARFLVLTLIKNDFHPGDRMIKSDSSSTAFTAQAFITSTGKKVLLVNKRDRVVEARLPAGTAAFSLATVDEASGEGAAHVTHLSGDTIRLAPFAVVVASVR